MSDLSERDQLADGVWWFDADSSRRRRAVLIFYEDRMRAETEDGMRRDSRIKDLEISSRIGGAPRRLVFADGVSLSAEDNNFIDAMLKKRGGRRAASPLHFIESHWRMIAAGAAGALLLAAAAVFYGIPAAAQTAARGISHEYLAEISEEIYTELRSYDFISASKLAPEDAARVEEIFAETAADYEDSGYNYRLRAHDFFPNAFAFPDGLVVMSDSLEEILNEGELRAVFAHEIGHVELRHGMRAVLESAGMAAFLILASGDISGVVAGGAFLVNLKYSRDHEREADCFAYHHLRRRGLSAALVGESLQKMEDAYKPKAEIKSAGETEKQLKEKIEKMEKEITGAEKPAEKQKVLEELKKELEELRKKNLEEEKKRENTEQKTADEKNAAEGAENKTQESENEKSAGEESGNEESAGVKPENKTVQNEEESAPEAATVTVAVDSKTAGSKEGEKNKVWSAVLRALSTHPATEERQDLAAACGE